MFAENHVMHVLYKKISEDDKIMLCKVLYKEVCKGIATDICEDSNTF